MRVLPPYMQGEVYSNHPTSFWSRHPHAQTPAACLVGTGMFLVAVSTVVVWGVNVGIVASTPRTEDDDLAKEEVGDDEELLLPLKSKRSGEFHGISPSAENLANIISLHSVFRLCLTFSWRWAARARRWGRRCSEGEGDKYQWTI
jgi:hypothetical protein